MVPARYFDGRTTRVHPVELSMIAGDLRVSGEGVDLRVPFEDILIDERLGNAPRRLHFPGGACCEVRDLAALDRLLSTTPHRESWVDRPQRHLGWILGAVLGFVLIVPVAYQWGLPWAAAVGARRISPMLATTISNEVMNTLDAGWLQKSKVPGERQRSLLAQFNALRISADGTIPARLLFRASSRLGANAFTLPDGTIVLLDDLTNNVGDDARVMAVLAHELGHAHERHGLQMMLRGAAVGAFLTFYVGDISQLLAAAPLAVVQARYSQQFEREADDFAATLLRRHGMSPALLADVLSRLSRLRPETAQHGYLLSHPPTDERIRHLRELAR